MNTDFSRLCTPAKIYFAIAIIASVIALFSGVRIMAVVLKLVFAFVWTFLLGWLCQKGFRALSWFLVLLPYIFIALTMFGLYRMSRGQQQMMKTVKLQGAYGQ
jgi:ABC-type dipeptide/oligopeptide/nickel transport system permease subunit